MFHRISEPSDYVPSILPSIFATQSMATDGDSTKSDGNLLSRGHEKRKEG